MTLHLEENDLALICCLLVCLCLSSLTMSTDYTIVVQLKINKMHKKDTTDRWTDGWTVVC